MHSKSRTEEDSNGVTVFVTCMFCGNEVEYIPDLHDSTVLSRHQLWDVALADHLQECKSVTCSIYVGGADIYVGTHTIVQCADESDFYSEIDFTTVKTLSKEEAERSVKEAIEFTEVRLAALQRAKSFIRGVKT